MIDIVETTTDKVIIVEISGAPEVIEITQGRNDVIEVITSGGGGGGDNGLLMGTTLDTGAQYRIVMFSDGTMRAIPSDAVQPTPPTNLAATSKIAVITLTWSAVSVPGATYYIFRNGNQIATTTALSYRDLDVVPNTHYTYQVQTRDAYGQRSVLSTSVAAFTDPALNSAPTITVTTWPTTIYPDMKTLVRVNAVDIDAQGLSRALNVNEGNLETTSDPSVWYLTV